MKGIYLGYTYEIEGVKLSIQVGEEIKHIIVPVWDWEWIKAGAVVGRPIKISRIK